MVDTAVQQHAAIRNRIYIAGRSFNRDPVPIQVTPKRYEAKVRTSNLGLRVERPFVIAGMPNVLQTHEIVLTWRTLQEPGLLEWIDLIGSMGQPFDVGIWKHVYDWFDGDASTKTYYLQRRQLTASNLPSGVPATTFADYETRVDVYSAPLGSVPIPTPTQLTVQHKSSSDIGAGDPSSGEAWVEDDGHMVGNRWVSTLRLGSAPAQASDILVASYMPLYKMVVDAENPRSYGEALQEPRGLRLVEFG